MIIATSLLQELLDAHPQLRSQMYFKSSLTALSHAMEDQVLAGEDQPIVLACFQRERFYRQEANRYLRISERSRHVYVLAAPETDFKNHSGRYETIAFDPSDALSQEWHLIVLGQQYSVCLICREHRPTSPNGVEVLPHMDQSRRFEGLWTFDRQVSTTAARLLLNRIVRYRPELANKVKKSLVLLDRTGTAGGFNQVDPAPFADRLVTYLQAGQYKQNKAYRQIAAKERQERLVNSITTAIRQSLDSHQVLSVAVQELGQTLGCDRCIIYQCSPTDQTARIEYEYTAANSVSLLGQTWLLAGNPWFKSVASSQNWILVEAVNDEPGLRRNTALRQQFKQAKLVTLLIMPVIYQNQLIGVVELHECRQHSPDSTIQPWFQGPATGMEMIEAIAAQVGVALIQAQAYADLETLNEQLADLERTRSNLIAITGHELRTPLSTIQVCLESLANEPDMPPELREVMLSTALSDAERMRKLVQDFLTLSRLESGRVDWHSEPISLLECIDLALSSIHTRLTPDQMPTIEVAVTNDLPFVEADGEWLVEVLVKLIDNACKFSQPQDHVVIQANRVDPAQVLISITDSGRGIEPDRLETVFERFYQEEGALRRTTGGTGLGLAICRQIIHNLGGRIWAESKGKDQGSSFRFTLAIAPN
jgi:DICT domain-containing protein/signal transduction histidine kinase